MGSLHIFAYFAYFVHICAYINLHDGRRDKLEA